MMRDVCRRRELLLSKSVLRHRLAPRLKLVEGETAPLAPDETLGRRPRWAFERDEPKGALNQAWPGAPLTPACSPDIGLLKACSDTGLL